MEYEKNDGQGLFTFKLGQDNYINIKEENFQGIYENIDTYFYEEATMFGNNSMEVTLQDDSPNSLIFDFRPDGSEGDWKLEDHQNKVAYEISGISGSFLIYMLRETIRKIYLSGEQDRFNSNLFSIMRTYRMNYSRRREREGDKFQELQGLPIIDFLLESMRGRMISLKITSEELRKPDFFLNLKNGYLFNSMYSTNRSLTEFMDLDSVMFRTRMIIDRTRGQLEDAPLRIYSPDTINYYKKAMSSSDPYIQYLSFYHILEYFFDETYHRYLVNDLRDSLTHPDFSYKNDDDLLKLAKFAQNRLRKFGEDGQGNELESLKYVLKEFVDITNLSNKLGSDIVTYYSTSKVAFSSGPVLNFKDDKSFSVLAKRIYFTRNSLVHSKSGKKELAYHPYHHEGVLKKEIPLIKNISEMIIINSAELL